MRVAKWIAFLGMVSMTGIILYGFIQGDFGQDGKALLSNPWGLVSFVDLYVGFILFSMWIIYREKHTSIKIIWVILMMVLGFFTASLYVWIMLNRSKGNWRQFFLGVHEHDLI